MPSIFLSLTSIYPPVMSTCPLRKSTPSLKGGQIYFFVIEDVLARNNLSFFTTHILQIKSILSEMGWNIWRFFRSTYMGSYIATLCNIFSTASMQFCSLNLNCDISARSTIYSFHSFIFNLYNFLWLILI